MADLYRVACCDGCGKSHTLYDTSAVRHAPGGIYTFTCPATGLVVNISPIGNPMIVSIVPSDAVPMEWVTSGVNQGDL
jgi:hypothetical protein